jgi:hypothetical protein
LKRRRRNKARRRRQIHKENKASADSRIPPLSLASADQETPPLREEAILLDFYRSLSEDERINMHEEAQKANPGVSTKELVGIKRVAM